MREVAGDARRKAKALGAVLLGRQVSELRLCSAGDWEPLLILQQRGDMVYVKFKEA